MRKLILVILALGLCAAATDKPAYRTGKVVKTFTREDAAGGVRPQAPEAEAAGYGSTCFIRISSGRRIYTAQFIPDDPKDFPLTLTPGQKVRFRIKDEELLLRAPDGKEWRTSLVSDSSPATQK